MLLFLGMLILCIFVLFPYRLQESAPVRLDDDGQSLVGEKYIPYTVFDDVPVELQTLIVRVEDQRFWMHLGIDPLAVARALRVWITT